MSAEQSNTSTETLQQKPDFLKSIEHFAGLLTDAERKKAIGKVSLIDSGLEGQENQPGSSLARTLVAHTLERAVAAAKLPNINPKSKTLSQTEPASNGLKRQLVISLDHAAPLNASPYDPTDALIFNVNTYNNEMPVSTTQYLIIASGDVLNSSGGESSLVAPAQRTAVLAELLSFQDLHYQPAPQFTSLALASPQ